MLKFEKEKEIAERLFHALKDEGLSYTEASGDLRKLHDKIGSKSKLV